MASTIPNEVLENIVKHLNSTTDVYRFRAVCKSWRSFTPPCKKQLQFPIQVNINDYKMCTITESIVYRLAPVGDDPCQRGWLTKVEDGEFGKTMLHPLSHNTLERQPNSTPKVFNSLECRVFEMAKLYKVHKLYDTKVALSSDLFSPAAMFVSGDGHLYHGKLGVGDKRCIEFSLVDPSHEGIRKCGFEDVIFYQGKFYAIYQDGRALVLYYGSFRVKMIVLSTLDDQYSRGFHKRYLVDSLGELLLVDRLVSASKWTRWDQQLNEFKVYKLNADKGRWDELSAEALSDRILIVDNDDCCISISTQDFPGHSGNSIYFSTRLKYGLTFGKVGVFNLSNRSHSVSQFDRYNIFYPPPST